MTEWKNKIIEYGTKPADQFQANPLNFRTHPQRQRKAMRASLDDNGWVAPVIENKRTGHLLDGHERVWQALKNENAEVPYILVDVAEEDEGKIIASLDPIAALAEIDKDKLDEVLRGIETDNPDLMKFLNNLAKDNGLYVDGEDIYTRNIAAPIYEPKGEKPEIDDLFDVTKTESLKREIDDADIPEEIKSFLRHAAGRHTVFNYQRIADYYAHSSVEVQELMENSALIIIDFDKAIELGYVELSNTIVELFEEDYPDV